MKKILIIITIVLFNSCGPNEAERKANEETTDKFTDSVSRVVAHNVLNNAKRDTILLDSATLDSLLK